MEICSDRDDAKGNGYQYTTTLLQAVSSEMGELAPRNQESSIDLIRIRVLLEDELDQLVCQVVDRFAPLGLVEEAGINLLLENFNDLGISDLFELGCQDFI